MQITKDIRSRIMDKDLSFNGRNIKIITRNEHVTLKAEVPALPEYHPARAGIGGSTVRVD